MLSGFGRSGRPTLIQVGAARSTPLTVNELVGEWLDALEPEAAAAFRSVMADHVFPFLGGLRADRLTTADARDLFARPRERESDPVALHLAAVGLHCAYSYAVSRGDVPSNPVPDLTAPAVTRQEEAPHE